MGMQNPYEKYKSNVITTASKEELTLMLYEGAIKFSNQAITALEQKNYEKTSQLIIRVQDIVREFQLTLNHSYEISRQLDVLYTYMFSRLIDANVKKDVEILQEVKGMLSEMRDTWKEASRLARQQNPAAVV